jgi:PAS domain S-box-containing protein
MPFLQIPGRVRPALLIWLLIPAIFIADLREPPGYEIPLLYTPVVLLAMWATRIELAVETAAVATLLIAIDSAIGRTGDASSAIFNRVLAIVVLWLTAGGVTMYRRSHERERLSLKDLKDTKYALDQAAIVATTDVGGRITYANPKFCEISKYTSEELIGQTHRIINSGLHPPEFFQEMWRTISRGAVWRGEIRNRAKDGSFYWVDTTIVPFLDERGLPYQYMAIRYEITERKRTEAALREQAALAQLGKMAAVVAHEVRNPLAGMRGALQVVGGRLAAGSQERTIVAEIMGRIDALSDIVHDLLQFARPRDPVPIDVPLSGLVRETVALLLNDPQFAAVVVHVDVGDVTIRADAEQLRLVLFNLLVNSAQAMQGRGEVRVYSQRSRSGVELRIADNGPGLTAEVRERLFEPFFTTKHKGTGLGLATARRILEAHHGSIELESRPEGGTVAIATLPAVSEQPSVMTAAAR